MTILLLAIILLGAAMAAMALYRGFRPRTDEPNYPAHYSYVGNEGGPWTTMIASGIFSVLVFGGLAVTAWLALYG